MLASSGIPSAFQKSRRTAKHFQLGRANRAREKILPDCGLLRKQHQYSIEKNACKEIFCFTSETNRPTIAGKRMIFPLKIRVFCLFLERNKKFFSPVLLGYEYGKDRRAFRHMQRSYATLHLQANAPVQNLASSTAHGNKLQSTRREINVTPLLSRI